MLIAENSAEGSTTVRRVRYGMIGGGDGAFIGPVHRTAAAITGQLDLVAGALSRDPERARQSGANLGLPAARSYASYAEMFDAERALPEDERIEFVTIVTPNDTHGDIARAALAAGFHVLCDKPVTHVLEDALVLQDAVAQSGKFFGVTHTYAGYPLTIQARRLVASGELGRVIRVVANYTQDWLSLPDDVSGNKQAEWRTDPTRSGEAGAFADIGVHAFHLTEFITGQRIRRLAAQLNQVIPGRLIDDDGAAMFELDDGGKGTLIASQVCTGQANGMRISIYCEKAGLHWNQESPNILRVEPRDAPAQEWSPGSNRPYLNAAARDICRTPAGHPEGYLEAFANIYAAFARDVRGDAFTETGAAAERGYASIEDGVSGMRFIRAAVTSSASDAAWVDVHDIERAAREAVRQTA